MPRMCFSLTRMAVSYWFWMVHILPPKSAPMFWIFSSIFSIAISISSSSIVT